MRFFTSVPRSVLSRAAIAAGVAALIVLAPTACGGPVTYARVGGSSMTPALQHGDLVLARTAASYGPGDVVAYRNPQLGLLMHRIAEVEGGRFTLRGDANGWIDSYRPTAPEIAGRLWLRVPKAGLLLDALRPPWGPVLLLVLSAAGVIVPRLRVRPAGARRGRRAAARGRPMAGGRPLTLYAPPGSLLAIASLLVAAAGLAGAAYAYARPLEQAVASDAPYQQRGQFAYAAVAPSGIYDNDTITPGQPLFVKLTGAMEVTFTYRVDSAQAGGVAGTAQLDAYLAQSNGWQRTIPITAPTPFAGAEAMLRGTVDLAQVKQLIDRVEAATTADYEQYRIVIAPRVQARIEGAPQALPAFAPQLIFRLSSKELQLDTQVGENGLERVSAGAFQVTSMRAAELSVLWLSPAVATARAWSVPFAMLGMVAFALLAWRTRRAFEGGEQGRIEAQFGALITTAHLVRPPTDRPLISVARFADLAAIAERNNLPVIQDALHLRQFMVLCNEATYHFSASEGAEPGAGPSAAAPSRAA